MKKIKFDDLPIENGIIMSASAAEHKDGVYGYLLETEEEVEETCRYGSGNPLCSTCEPDACRWYETWRDQQVGGA